MRFDRENYKAKVYFNGCLALT